MAVSRLMLSVLVLSTMTISSTVSQSAATCTRTEQLCWGRHHPQCSVFYAASSSADTNSTCSLRIRCSYNTNFTNNAGLCFLIRTALPTVTVPGVTPSTYIYNLVLDIFVTNGTRLSRQSITGNRITALTTLNSEISAHYGNAEFASFRVVSVYLCDIVTPCSPAN